MSPRAWHEQVRDILDAIAEIEEFTRGMQFEDFCEDGKTLKAVELDFILLPHQRGLRWGRGALRLSPPRPAIPRDRRCSRGDGLRLSRSSRSPGLHEQALAQGRLDAQLPGAPA